MYLMKSMIARHQPFGSISPSIRRQLGAHTTPRPMTRHCAAAFKECWIRTDDAQVVAAGLESFQPLTLLIDSSDLANANAALKRWQKLGKIQAVLLTSDDTLVDESTGETIGRLCRISNAKDLADVQSAMEKQILDDRQVLLVEASDWTIIPAENLVAASQNRSGKLFGIASDAAAARVLLEALEVGVDGVVLAPSNPAEVRSLATYLDNRARENLGAAEAYQTAKVVEVRPVGMGDRACIDLAESLHPGEGILVGSWAKGLFLVHSECEDSGGWINARPFRVNAGPVHAYTSVPDGHTKYLSELRSGDEVIVYDANGIRRTALVGRVKIERRPLVLIRAEGHGGEEYAILLQNAETVKLVGPNTDIVANNGSTAGFKTWKSISVAEMRPGDEVYVSVQAAARHTGIPIEEMILER